MKLFKWGTAHSCRSRGCINIRGQSWIDKKLPAQLSWSAGFVDLWYFCSLLTYRNVQCLIWKIWFISLRRLKAEVMVLLLIWFIFAQSSTLISYHTETFVKTKVGCTVPPIPETIDSNSQQGPLPFKINWIKYALNGLNWTPV